MKKNIIVGITLAIGMLSVGAMAASAAGPCCKDGKCTDSQAVQQFTGESSALISTLKVKDAEIAQERGFEGPNLDKISMLESERKAIKGQIDSISLKYGIPACCAS